MSTIVERSEDAIPAGYPYSWSPGATLTIGEFVAKVFVQGPSYTVHVLYRVQYKPSMVQNDGTKPVRTRRLR